MSLLEVASSPKLWDSFEKNASPPRASESVGSTPRGEGPMELLGKAQSCRKRLLREPEQEIASQTIFEFSLSPVDEVGFLWEGSYDAG